MSGMNQQDMRILSHYAREGNRELYWNYLAQHPGDDGYGLLALGVVRNDNAPGQVANLYADNHARAGGRNLSERDWENFGVDLIRKDLALRQQHFADGRTDLALNLPARDVQRAHDQAFTHARIDPNAWTPRILLEGARRSNGENEVEQVWSHMLDNGGLGLGRAGNTVADIARNLPPFEAGRYGLELTATRAAAAAGSHPQTDPNTIGGPPLSYHYNERDRSWASISSGGMGGMPYISEVRDPARRAELDDARAVRLHRQDLRDNFHEADPNRDRPIARSPRTLAENAQPEPSIPGSSSPGREPNVQLASAEPFDPRRADHPQHSVYCQCRDGVQQLDAAHGRAYDKASEQFTARLTQLACDNHFDRVDRVVLSCGTDRLGPGENAFVVRGEPMNPASQRAHVNTREAMETPVEQSFQALAANRAQSAPQPGLQHAALQPGQHEPQAEQQRNPIRSMV